MRNTDITLVFQGAFKPYVTRDGDWYAQNIRTARRVLPGAKIILSTWQGTEIPASLAVDDVVFSSDPGGLAPLKLDDDKANNVNRQLLSTAAGLAAVTTSHAVKIRTDCSLQHAGFLDYFGEQVKLDKGRERLLACSFFTLDPTIFECVPFHLSDWFHFGRTDLLRAYWSAEPLTPDQARFYERNQHPSGSSFFEKKFRAKFAAEQHICSHYARLQGYHCPQFLNDAQPEVMQDYYRFLATQVILLDPWQIGLDFKKYNWVGNSLFQCMNNLMHLDWLQIAGQQVSAGAGIAGLQRLIDERAHKKDIVRAGFRYSRSLHPFLFDPKRGGAGMRRAAHRMLRFL